MNPHFKLFKTAVAAFVSCPAEVPLVRMANDNALPLAQRRNYRGVGDAFLRIYREEGVRAFFRGVEPFILRAIMLGSIQVGTYDYFREVYRRQYQITDPVKNVFAAAMTSGLLYSFATMPLETVKNRMAVQKPDPKTGSLLYRSIPQTFHQIVKREGLTRLWSGYLPYYLRCGIHTLVMFSSIEFMRSQYDKTSARQL